MSIGLNNHYLLMFHGYTQSSDKMQKRVAVWMSKKECCKYESISLQGKMEIDDKSYGWWNLESPEKFTQHHTYQPTEMIQDSMDEVADTLKTIIEKIGTTGTLNVIGFSQGAVFVEMLMAAGHFDKIPVRQFRVMLVSPSGIMDEKWKKPITHLPANNVHVMIGKKEGVFNITPESYLTHTCIPEKNLEFHSHLGGHYVPGKKDKNIILYWLGHHPSVHGKIRL